MARETLRELGPAKLSWSAILGGSFIALGLMVLLDWLGLAIGFTTIDDAPRGAGIWLGVWLFIVPILALFVGGLIAGRFGSVTNRKGGAVHGAVTWGFTTLVSLVLTSLLLATVIGGVARLGGAVAGATGTVFQQVTRLGGGQVAEALGVTAQDLLAPINRARAQRGLPPLQPENLQAALQDAVNRALREGRLDRELLVTSLVQNTEISREEAERFADQIAARLGGLEEQIAGAAQTAQQTLSSLLWYTFAFTLLSLLAAILGGALSVSPTQKQPLAEAKRAPVPGGPPREVYP